MKIAIIVLVAASAWGQAPPGPRVVNPAVKEAVSYLLTTATLEKYAQASRNVTALIAKDSSYLQKANPDPKDAPKTVDETVAWSKSHLPSYFAAVEKAGIPFREYVVFQAGLIINVEAYKRPQYAASFHVRRENIAFVQVNWPRIQQVLAEQNPRAQSSAALSR